MSEYEEYEPTIVCDGCGYYSTDPADFQQNKQTGEIHCDRCRQS